MPATAEPFAQGHRGVLRPVIMVVDQPGQVDLADAAAGPEGLLERVQDKFRGHRRAGTPAQDPAGVGVDDEGDVDPARPGRDIGVGVGPQRPASLAAGGFLLPALRTGRAPFLRIRLST